MTNEEIARLKEAAEYTINVGGDEIGIHPREIVGVIEKLQQAAARIEQLETENARLRLALEPFACRCEGRCKDMEWLLAGNTTCASNRARAALAGKSRT